MELQGHALHSDTRTGRYLQIMDENMSPGSCKFNFISTNGKQKCMLYMIIPVLLHFKS